MDKKLTLVLPMYNVEAYVVDTLRSIYSQPESSDVEVILVDDGSPDNSARVAHEYLDSIGATNWHLIRQENKGLGGARNTGLDAAKTDYVWFIDTDDLISEDSLRTILTVIGRFEPAVITYNYQLVEDESLAVRSSPVVHPQNSESPISGRDLMVSGRFVHGVQFCVLNRNFLISNNLRFKEHLFHEDTEFTPRMLYLAPSVIELDGSLYKMRLSPNSITRSVNFKRNFDMIKVAGSLERFCIERNITAPERNVFCRLIATSLNAALSTYGQMPEDLKKSFAQEVSKAAPLFRNYKKSTVMKHRLQSWIFGLFPNNPLKAYSVMRLGR